MTGLFWTLSRRPRHHGERDERRPSLRSHTRPPVQASGAVLGDQLVEVDLPAGTRVIYAKPPMAGLPDPDAAVRYALNNPLGDEPLYAKLRPGMRVTIAIDDLSMPLPAMKSPDNRARVLGPVIKMLDEAGVEDVELIIATAFHRPMKPKEIEHIVGKRVFDRFWPDRLYNHDAERPGGLTSLGKTADGIEVELNARAASSDLIIYVNLTCVDERGTSPRDRTGRLSHPEGPPQSGDHSETECYMEPARSTLAKKMEGVGKLIEEKLNVFHIETTVNTGCSTSPWPSSRRMRMSSVEPKSRAMSALIKTSVLAPARTPSHLRSVPAPYEMIGVFAGACSRSTRRSSISSTSSTACPFKASLTSSSSRFRTSVRTTWGRISTRSS